MKPFEEAMAFRHACKRFDDTKKIPKGELEALLETVRLSPSSFGMEPWRLIVVQSEALKARLQPLCWNQQQIVTCSDLLVFTSDIDAVKGDSAYVKQMFARRGLDAEATAAYVKRYGEYLTPLEADGRLLENWTAKQCYIAAANLMTHAAVLGIDSCPIEGFEKEAVETALELPPHQRLALIVTLGYRVDTPKPRQRLDSKEIVSYM